MINSKIFTVSVDAIWKELGYVRKCGMLLFIKKNYVENVDYWIDTSYIVTTKKGGSPKLNVFITQAKYEEIKERILRQPRHNYVEKNYRQALYETLGGTKDAHTPVGLIDLLTETEVIEVKKFKDWKGGLGQLLAYSCFHKKEKRLHLFGKCSEENLKLIVAVCSNYHVKVTWEE